MGAWEVGMYAALDEKMKQFKGLDGKDAIPLLEMSMGGGNGNSFGVFRMDWSKTEGTFLTRNLVKKKKGTRTKTSMTKEEVGAAVNRLTREVIGMEEHEVIDDDVTLQELGFDSMMSVELRRRMGEELQVELP